MYQELLLRAIPLLVARWLPANSASQRAAPVQLQNATAFAFICTSVIANGYNFNNGHICKHIHRVHSILQLQDHQAESIEAEHTVQDLGQQQCEITENTEHPSLVYANSDADPQRGLYIAISIFTTSALLLDHSIQLQTFNTLQKDLQSQINTNDNQIMPYLDHVNALLHQAVATCKAATQVFKLPEPLVKKENMPPGKSLDHQWRFVKTTKTPGRKKNGNVLRYSYYHRNQSSKIR